MPEPKKPVPSPGTEAAKSILRVVPASQLFGSEREICIDHGGVRYRLRITRRNKLILQK